MNKRYDTSKQWYAIHTYSGYEEKVAESIRQRADSLDMKDKIFQVLVPKEKMIEVKNGKRKVVEKKIFQGYALVEMKLTDETWYIVRNTPGVTGFVGSGTEPTPVSDGEIAKIREELEPEEALEPFPAGAIPGGEVAAAPPKRHITGAVYISCTGRGGLHFGGPSAEMQVVRRALGDVPLVGFFAAGEVAHHHLYAYTGVLTVFTAES